MEGQKLTKKQRKSLAFREGKRKKRTEEDVQDVPEAEGLEEEVAEAEEPVTEAPKLAKSEAGKKRKRGEDEDTPKPGKKRKAGDGEAVEGGEQAEDGAGAAAKKAKEKQKKRYILFVGNLPKNVTQDQIAAHFSSLPSAPSIRLRTPPPPKPGQPPAQAGRAKIFAFLEFADPASLQAALKLHRSNLGGKLINVELTVGGGGRGEGRREKLALKRRQAAERMRTYAKEGAGEAKQVNKAWKQERKERGGRDGRQRRDNKPRRPAASGVNAIPVG